MKEVISKSGDVGSDIYSVAVETGNSDEVSPLTSDSVTSLGGGDGSKKPKSQQMTVLQKQEQQANDFSDWVNYKDVHKAATKLYSKQLSVDGGMPLCEVEKKLKFKVSPSKETIRCHVMELKSIGVSPSKRGPDGIIPSHVYKSFCIAVSTKTWICQLNAKVCTCKKQILHSEMYNQ